MTAQPERVSSITSGDADISGDGKYRYVLWREWWGTASHENWRWLGAKDGRGVELGEPKSCLFIMLNPSTADATLDDPTIRRCIGFAKRERFDRLEVVNLFARRCTKPADLFAMGNHGEDIIGPRNQEVIEQHAADAGLIICAWGAHGSWGGQDKIVLGWLDGAARQPPRRALKLTGQGHPSHPLYLPKDAKLIEFGGAT